MSGRSSSCHQMLGFGIGSCALPRSIVDWRLAPPFNRPAVEAFDVGIVGAGVHGASVAFHLASRGVRPVIFERTRPAGGPTGRSSAVCRAYYTNPFLARAARESLDMFAGWARAVGGDAG